MRAAATRLEREIQMLKNWKAEQRLWTSQVGGRSWWLAAAQKFEPAGWERVTGKWLAGLVECPFRQEMDVLERCWLDADASKGMPMGRWVARPRIN